MKKIMTEQEWRGMFGKNLKDWANRRGFTQEGLALRCGSSQDNICAYMNGKHTPSGYMMERLACALEIPTEWLLLKDTD